MSKGGPSNTLRTPWQIRTAALDRLREDERLWTAYERGWCDFLQMYLDSKLMQGETDYIALQPADHRNNNVTMGGSASVARGSASVARGSASASADAGDAAPSAGDAADDSQPSPPPPPPAPPSSPADAGSEYSTTTDRDGRRQRCVEMTPSSVGSVGDTSDFDFDDDDDDDDDDRTRCYDASESGGGADTGMEEEYASGDSSRDADSEVRRVMFGRDRSPDPSDPEAVRSFSDYGPSADDNARSAE